MEGFQDLASLLEVAGHLGGYVGLDRNRSGFTRFKGLKDLQGSGFRAILGG